MISYMGGIVLSPVKIACAILTAPRGGSGSRVRLPQKKRLSLVQLNLFFPAVRTGLEPALARQAPWHCLIPRQNRLRYFDRPQRGHGVAGSDNKKEVGILIPNLFFPAVRTGLEPATPCVTGMYSNQLNYRTVLSRFYYVCRGVATLISQTRCKDSSFYLSCKI